MKVLKNERRDEMYPNLTFRQRSMGHDRARRRQVHREWMILGILILAIAILAVVAVLKITAKNADKGKPEPQKAEIQKQVVAEPTPTPTATPEGSDRWLRKDLDPDKPMVALTFDDGPYTPVTSKILDTLEKYDGRATFFCVGNRLSQFSEVVGRAYDMGCELASHTYTHTYLTSLTDKQIHKQQNQTNAMFKKIIGCKTTALRPPGGFVDDKVRKNVSVPMYLWSVDSEDWKSRDTHKTLVRCKKIEDGDVVLMHDLYPTTAGAVEKLVPRLVKKGYQLVTVDEMFYYKNIPVKAGEVHFSGK